MKAGPSRWIERFGVMARDAGASSWGIVAARDVDGEVMSKMEEWVKAGKHASMNYMERHVELKESLDNVLPGCRSVASFVFPYIVNLKYGSGELKFSRYALVPDYHSVIRKQLRPLAENIKSTFGGEARICVDSAPVAERYWAVTCGLGSIGRNGLFYAPGYGSWVFIAEILTTAQLPGKMGEVADRRLSECEACSRCISACPGNAIESDGTIDCNRCRSYITIECRDGRLPHGVALGGRIFGCDICQEVCPANEAAKSSNTCFTFRQDIASLTREDIASMNEEKFREISQGSALKRITLQQLKRNAGLTTGSGN